jgi:hypothetical protein
MMADTLLTCPKCNVPLPENVLIAERLEPCPTCNVPVQAKIYSAFFKPVEQGSVGEAIVVEGEASCYYHPQKRAAIHCGSCGRFVCALCDVELNGEHICPACLESGQKKGKLTELENKRMLWDSAAFSLAVAPLFVWPLTLLTAPAAVILAIYAWNKPSSIIGRTRARIYLAILIGLLQIAGWVLLFTGILRQF